ncbi:MAG: indolepyruvate oxidoreductase subunit beta [Actinomycetia bacterium]|nr:indolepyruvate oxidoreductase subunit beta [Actinomycetes bacterium]
MKNDNINNREITGQKDSGSGGSIKEPDLQKSSEYLENNRKRLKQGGIVSVMFSGVGGQGIILATTVLARAAMFEGFDVKVSEVHGMAQRGGSVIGSVRFGEKVHSPIVDRADLIVSLEKLEAARYLDLLKPEGFLFINDYEIYPVSIYLEDREYPSDIIKKISKATSRYKLIEASGIAADLGEIRASNTVLIGSLSMFLPISPGSWMCSIKESVPERALKLNINAFEKGREIVK